MQYVWSCQRNLTQSSIEFERSFGLSAMMCNDSVEEAGPRSINGECDLGKAACVDLGFWAAVSAPNEVGDTLRGYAESAYLIGSHRAVQGLLEEGSAHGHWK